MAEVLWNAFLVTCGLLVLIRIAHWMRHQYMEYRIAKARIELMQKAPELFAQLLRIAQGK